MRDGTLKKNAIFFAVAAVIALFARTAAFSFIGLDDAAYTFRNPFVAGGLSFANAVEAFTNFRHGGIWMPATYISYMADASFCKATGMPLVGWMHLVNVFLHAINLLLLCRLLHILAGRDSTWILVGALLWAIHPLRVEPVAWIAARKELLWSMFAVAGLIFWVKSIHSTDGRKGLCLGCAYFFCALSCISKPTAMCFPFLACLVEWRIGRETGKPNSAGWWRRYVPFVLLAGMTAAIAAYSQTHVAGQDANALYAAPFLDRLVGAMSALGYYVRAMVWPFGFHIDCRAVNGLWPLGAGWNLAALGMFAVLAAFVSRQSLFAFVWFVLSLLPTLGLLGSFGFEAHADRFAYLPSMAFVILLVDCMQNRSSGIVLKIAVTAVVALSVITFDQLGFWRDDGTAYRRALSCDPEHPRAMVHVADADCARRRNFDSGIALYRKALSRADTVPSGGFDVADVKARLAYALSSRGRHEDFAEIKSIGAPVLENLKLDRRGMMLDALGTAFMYDGDWKRAALLFQASIDAPARFWPKASTRRKLEECQKRMR